MFVEIWNTAGAPAGGRGRLQGQVYLVVDDSETLLQPGDIVVQRGTNHAWDNRSDAPARLVFILIHAEFEPALQAQLHEMVLVP